MRKPQRIEQMYLVSSHKDEMAEDVAILFCAMDSDQMSDFFDKVADISNQWAAAETQWRYMEKKLTERAKQVIDDIKDHTE